MTNFHVKHGFLAQVYGPWVRFEGSEWGDCMALLWEAYDRAYIWSDEEFEALEKILRDHLLAMEDFFFDEGMYEDEVLAARLEYPKAAEYWRERAEEFQAYKTRDGQEIYPGSVTTFEETERGIPDWMKPPEAEDVRDAKRRQLIDQREKLEAQLHKLNNDIAGLV